MEKNVAYNNDDDYPRTDANGVFVVSGRKPRDRVWGIIFGLVVLSTLLIGGINYHAYADLVKSEGIPKPSEMEYGQACDGPLFKSKLEANNERYKVANASPYSRRKLMEDGNKITRGRRRESLGPDGPDVLFPERLGVSEFTENNDENNNNNNNNNAAHLAKTKKLSFNSDEPFDVTVVINAALWCAGLSLLVSVLMGMFIVFMFRTCAHKTVWGIIYFKIFALYAMALAMLNMGSLEGFIIFALIGSLAWFVYWLWTDELNVVASMLAVSSQALKDNPGIIWFVLLLQVAVMVFVVPVVGFIYVAELGGLPDVNPKAIYQNSSTLACADYVGRPVNCCATTPGAWVAWYEALAIIAMIWAFAFALETRMYVIGGTVCQWYFAPKGTKSFRGFTLTSTKHALGPSFGTVSFGSAIMTAVEMMRQAMERAREDNEQNIFLCLVQSCLECIWEFIEYLSKFAMLQASMTGEAFCDAASSIFDLLKRNFLLAYGTYAFPSMILQILSLVFALLAAAGSYAINFALFEVAEVSMAPLYAIVCAIITGVVVWCSLSYFTMILVNTTDAVFVCYAKDKDRNEIHHEEMHAVFENAIQRRQEARGEIVRQPAGPYAYGAGNTVNKSY